MTERNQIKQIHNPLDKGEDAGMVLDVPFLCPENRYQVHSAQCAICEESICWKPPLWRININLPKAAHALCHNSAPATLQMLNLCLGK